MKLKEIVIHNFRGYRALQRIRVDDLTAIIGRNDSGKSSILEALGIFLDAPECSLDLADFSVYNPGQPLRIGCVFGDVPPSLVIDTTSETTLQREYLLNEAGDLEVHRLWIPSAGKPKPSGQCVVARHPSASGYNDLLRLKNDELKTRARSLNIDLSGVNLTTNHLLREAIRSSSSNLELTVQEIDLSKGDDGKAIWEQLRKQFPLFALFRADRPSTDQDSEVQDPMSLAVRQALLEVQESLEQIKNTVATKALEVARLTVDKLHEFEGADAETLTPSFKAEPKWDAIFKLSLTSEDQVPLNKRGSGFRRLVLISFFRAEAERKRRETVGRGIIYAIEEPEVSQHPDNQRMLLRALHELSDTPGCQVLLTTHVPGLAQLLPTSSLRFLRKSPEKVVSILNGDSDTYDAIANSLGIVPDRRVRVVVFVEGRNDILCLSHFARLYRTDDPLIPDLVNDPRIIFMPLNGGNLREWVERHYLRELHLPEVHIYDRGTAASPKYAEQCATVNARPGNSFACSTDRAEMENYLHPDAIKEELGVDISVEEMNDVPKETARALHEADASSQPWGDLTLEEIRLKENRVKKRLNDAVASRMTLARLQSLGVADEVKGWLNEITTRL